MLKIGQHNDLSVLEAIKQSAYKHDNQHSSHIMMTRAIGLAIL